MTNRFQKRDEFRRNRFSKQNPPEGSPLGMSIECSEIPYKSGTLLAVWDVYPGMPDTFSPPAGATREVGEGGYHSGYLDAPLVEGENVQLNLRKGNSGSEWWFTSTPVTGAWLSEGVYIVQAGRYFYAMQPLERIWGVLKDVAEDRFNRSMLGDKAEVVAEDALELQDTVLAQLWEVLDDRRTDTIDAAAIVGSIEKLRQKGSQRARELIIRHNIDPAVQRGEAISASVLEEFARALGESSEGQYLAWRERSVAEYDAEQQELAKQNNDGLPVLAQRKYLEMREHPHHAYRGFVDLEDERSGTRVYEDVHGDQGLLAGNGYNGCSIDTFPTADTNGRHLGRTISTPGQIEYYLMKITVPGPLQEEMGCAFYHEPIYSAAHERERGGGEAQVQKIWGRPEGGTAMIHLGCSLREDPLVSQKVGLIHDVVIRHVQSRMPFEEIERKVSLMQHVLDGARHEEELPTVDELSVFCQDHAGKDYAWWKPEPFVQLAQKTPRSKLEQFVLREFLRDLYVGSRGRVQESSFSDREPEMGHAWKTVLSALSVQGDVEEYLGVRHSFMPHDSSVEGDIQAMQRVIPSGSLVRLHGTVCRLTYSQERGKVSLELKAIDPPTAQGYHADSLSSFEADWMRHELDVIDTQAGVHSSGDK